ncbi:MAG: hypothetical protein JSW45_10720 [Thiotrichales bacterium]|nr:MAG: hypothetical protein JSW45_10720 [Thiotrichales bacterium]
MLVNLCLTPSSFADIAHNVVIVTSSDSSYQRRTAGRIRENLEEKGARTMVVSADSIASITPNGRTLYVAIGDEAINNLNRFDADAMALRMTSREMPNRRYTSTKADLITAQPDCRHIRLIRSIDPGWSTIGVLSSIESLDIAAALTKCSIRHNINLQVYAITDTTDLLKTLETAVVKNKVLLAINDPLIYNSNTVKNILLTAYRHRKPVIGYSDSFVQAGAVAAVYTSPESAADKAVSIVSKFFENSWQFGKKRYYTDDFSISTNIQVSKSLDINIPDEDSIRRSIERMEKKP